MPSTHPERSSGLTSALSSVGLALVVAVLVVLLSPSPTQDGGSPATSATTAPHPTITLDDLTADLSAALEDDPDTTVVDVVGPDGEVVTVVIPSTTTTEPPPPSTSTTTTTTTTIQPPRPTIPPQDWADDILDSILGQSVPTTIPEVVGDAP